MGVELRIEPPPSSWPNLIEQAAALRGQSLLGQALAAWRQRTRAELQLSLDRPIVATGHQALLWHPGILAKFMIVNEFARQAACATANLVVDQHVGPFGEIEVPTRADDGSLSLARIVLTRHRPEVPMSLHPAFDPQPASVDLRPALPSVVDGLKQIGLVVAAHAGAANAAEQMSRALDDLMRPWVDPMPGVTSTQLINTSLARALLERMIADPRRCVESYNRAVAAVPEGGIGPLAIEAERVELPLWRIEREGRRAHAWQADVAAHVAGAADAPAILPRALFMTALVRLGMCDLFVHGTGGATYDRAMELWLRNWLTIEPAPIAMATATLRLPLECEGAHMSAIPDVQRALAAARAAWHDPHALIGGGQPSRGKRAWIDRISAAPRRSLERRQMYRGMHEEMARARGGQRERIEAARLAAEQARRHAACREIAQRRTWAFPLYPREMIDQLAREGRRRWSG